MGLSGDPAAHKPPLGGAGQRKASGKDLARRRAEQALNALGRHIGAAVVLKVANEAFINTKSRRRRRGMGAVGCRTVRRDSRLSGPTRPNV